MEYVLALDGGTGSIRAVLFNQDGEQAGVAQHEWVHKVDPLYPGSMDFDTENNWPLVKQCMKEVIQQNHIHPSSIKAISATSMREGFVLYNKSGYEIWACSNVDARASEEVKDLKELDDSLEESIYKLSGQTFALGALPRLLWLKNHKPDLYEQAHTITMINDWILYKLSGVLQIDPSNGCTTGMLNLLDRKYSKSIAQICSVKDHLFPQVNEAGTIIGKVKESVANEVQLSPHTLIVTGGGDAQMASIGVGAIQPEQTVISGGSFWQQEVNVSQPFVSKNGRIRTNCHVLPHLWQIETIAFSPGLVMRWFRDTFCEQEKEEALRSGEDVYSILEDKANSVPVGSHGVIPIFSDVMIYISWRHASPSFINLSISPEKSGKEVLFRALEENAALLTYGNLKMIEEETGFYPKEVIFTSGASKGALWGQILADVLGITVKVPVIKETAALGTAMYAGVAAGLYSSIQAIVQKVVKWEKTYLPDLENHQQYQVIFRQWRSVYVEQLKLADQGLTEHMWKAPGV
ncbi:autoinducer-2 kinase [Cytobacillus purgationiresistens]|uniref:Autoinducer 2 (AI-2) kinase n=1 Tax=Cytobacillus purgationiresistens TaxID=863449 RepID=A0ABU0AEK9_9BACI|nr:autoinducer-2 kinase [Cytobacillus purgationiresistens]MDQ0269181.1 autoinducer 2 (AI-2) kinase [Cytobacillus purgationiresistens]